MDSCYIQGAQGSVFSALSPCGLDFILWFMDDCFNN